MTTTPDDTTHPWRIDVRLTSGWTSVPGRHTLRGAADQVKHLTINGFVEEIRISRAQD